MPKKKKSRYSKQRYQRNKAKIRERAKKNQQKSSERNRKYIERYKKRHPCPCGEKETCCLSFHHIGEKNKDANISDMINRGYSIKKIKQEIAKCIVLCLNCHAKIHKRKKVTYVK